MRAHDVSAELAGIPASGPHYRRVRRTRVVGRSMANHLRTDLVPEALEMAQTCPRWSAGSKRVFGASAATETQSSERNQATARGIAWIQLFTWSKPGSCLTVTSAPRLRSLATDASASA